MALHLGSIRWLRSFRRGNSKHTVRIQTLRQRVAWACNFETLEPRSMFAASDYRSIDGTGNNLAHPKWGSTDEQLLRMAPAEYGDGISTPAGADRPGAREISNALAAHSDEATPNDRNLTAYIYVWGQFLDHDLDLTKNSSPAERFNIAVPTGDPSFDPNGTGTQIIPLNRSIFDPATGTSTSNPRQQINQVTRVD